MNNADKRRDQRSQVKPPHGPAAEVPALMASDKLAGVRLRLEGDSHVVTRRGQSAQCGDLGAVRGLLQEWGGQS